MLRSNVVAMGVHEVQLAREAGAAAAAAVAAASKVYTVRITVAFGRPIVWLSTEALALLPKACQMPFGQAVAVTLHLLQDEPTTPTRHTAAWEDVRVKLARRNATWFALFGLGQANDVVSLWRDHAGAVWASQQHSGARQGLQQHDKQQHEQQQHEQQQGQKQDEDVDAVGVGTEAVAAVGAGTETVAERRALKAKAWTVLIAGFRAVEEVVAGAVAQAVAEVGPLSVREVKMINAAARAGALEELAEVVSEVESAALEANAHAPAAVAMELRVRTAVGPGVEMVAEAVPAVGALAEVGTGAGVGSQAVVGAETWVQAAAGAGGTGAEAGVQALEEAGAWAADEALLVEAWADPRADELLMGMPEAEAWEDARAAVAAAAGVHTGATGTSGPGGQALAEAPAAAAVQMQVVAAGLMPRQPGSWESMMVLGPGAPPLPPPPPPLPPRAPPPAAGLLPLKRPASPPAPEGQVGSGLCVRGGRRAAGCSSRCGHAVERHYVLARGQPC